MQLQAHQVVQERDDVLVSEFAFLDFEAVRFEFDGLGLLSEFVSELGNESLGQVCGEVVYVFVELVERGLLVNHKVHF